MTLHGNVTNNRFRFHLETLKISHGKLFSLHVSSPLTFVLNGKLSQCERMVKTLQALFNMLWNTLILHEMGIPDHLTCLLRNLYAGQEATVRTGHGTTDWFQIRKGVYQGCILSPCLLYAEYIMWNARLDEAQARIKIARRNIHNFRYADDTPLWQKVKRN